MSKTINPKTIPGLPNATREGQTNTGPIVQPPNLTTPPGSSIPMPPINKVKKV